MMTENNEKQNLENHRSESPALPLKQLNAPQPVKTEDNRMAWIREMTIPKWFSLGVILVAGFLIFPAYKGFTAGGEIQRLIEEVGSVNHSLSLSRVQIAKLENDLHQVGIQGQGRRAGDHLARGLGLFISPILSLEQKKSGLPDLIHIDFRNNGESVLAFDLTHFNFEELQMSIMQEGNLVWIQTISIPPKTLFVQNVATFVLTRETLSAGEYKIKIDGNPSREIKRLSEFDLTIER